MIDQNDNTNKILNNLSNDNVYRVMIADIDPLMRDTLSTIISKIDGFSVTHSIGNFETVVEQFKRDSPDVVILELDVPWLRGLDIAKEILEIDPYTAIYTISTYDYFEISQFSMEIKIAGHILKPVSPSLIIETLKHHKQFYKHKASPQLAILSNIVQEKSFDRFYYNINNLAVSLQDESGHNTSNVNTKLNHIHLTLSNCNRSDSIISPFPILDPTLLSIDRIVELCLFYIMNSIFILKSTKRNERLKTVFAFLDKNITKDIGLSQLVENCFISQGHLSRIFKSCFNITVMEYIHIRKLIISKIYFLLTDYTISEVADIVGYNERSYFSKIFKKFEKITIQQYKQTKNQANTKEALVMSDSHKFINEIFGIELL
ncbi:MAG: DNA-binding response regulator [Deltaproteobacteria bacterium]|jgi:two-component system response regulator YesN|nr:DNA-binding response regulator [Deltaproteobacteria bacterium]